MTAYVSFSVPTQFADKTKDVLALVRHTPPASQHISKFTEILLEMTDLGLDYYFRQMSKRLGVGRIGMTFIEMGVKVVTSGISSMIHPLLKMLTQEQLISLADFVEESNLRLEKRTCVAFSIPDQLADQMKKAIEMVRTQPPSPTHKTAITDVQLQMSDRAMDYFFLDLSKRLNVNQMGYRLIDIGVKVCQKSLRPMITNIVKGLTSSQLFTLADFLEEMLVYKDQSKPVVTQANPVEKVETRAAPPSGVPTTQMAPKKKVAPKKATDSKSKKTAKSASESTKAKPKTSKKK